MRLLIRSLPFLVAIPMTLVQAQSEFASELFKLHDEHRINAITSKRFTQAQMLGWLSPLRGQNVFTEERVGTSAEGRPLLLLTVGSGPVRVLLWSQMHGDESTATMALLDMLQFMAQRPDHPVVSTIRSRLTLLLLPMINPDGAERFERRTAQLIDMNRDALALRTPEARALWGVREQYQPAFGFNLHDQDPRYTAGVSSRITAISLLAPAVNDERTDTPGRVKAKQVASVFAAVMDRFIPGHVAKYDDTFEPRAFGDNIQKAGTSTILVESGGWPHDPEKQFLRKLNFVGFLESLYAIATEQYLKADVSAYEALPFNAKNAYDLILHNVTYKAGNNVESLQGDLGVNFERRAESKNGNASWIGTVTDFGDLSTFGAFEERDGTGLVLDSTVVQIDKTFPKEELLSKLGLK